MTEKRSEQKRNRVLASLSGRLESAVAAALLKNQGYDVHALFIDLRGEADRGEPLSGFETRCRAMGSLAQAKRVAEKLQLPLHVVSADQLFKERVLDSFIHDYLAQRLPDSCIRCAAEVRLPLLFAKADELGFPWVATGHYARVVPDPSGELSRLYAGVDAQKDQSFSLFRLGQPRLRRLLLPLGGLTGAGVRKLADQLKLEGLSSSIQSGAAPASAGDCYAAQPGYEAYIESKVTQPLRPGGVVRNRSGDVVGEHAGLHRFSVGQSGGFTLLSSNPETYVVTGFDPEKQALIVDKESEPAVQKFLLGNTSWLRPLDQLRDLKCSVRFSVGTRPGAAGTLSCRVTHFENELVQVELEARVEALNRGQIAVFYSDEEVLGGGMVERVGGLK